MTRWLKRHLQWLGTEIDLKRLNSVVEDKEMLAENLENWPKKERQEGRLEGREEGEVIGQRHLLQRQLGLNFGELPTWAQQLLDEATPEQLEAWSAAILTANTLDDVFKR